jgi:hypothetical protein
MQVPAGNSIGSYPPAINATILPVEQKTLPIVEIPATMLHPHNSLPVGFAAHQTGRSHLIGRDQWR